MRAIFDPICNYPDIRVNHARRLLGEARRYGWKELPDSRIEIYVADCRGNGWASIDIECEGVGGEFTCMKCREEENDAAPQSPRK